MINKHSEKNCRKKGKFKIAQHEIFKNQQNQNKKLKKQLITGHLKLQNNGKWQKKHCK